MSVEAQMLHHKCPVCGTVNDAVMVVNDLASVIMPKPGDLSVCVYCEAIGVFQEDGTVRVATAEECDELPDWLKEKLSHSIPGQKPS